jgi:hypothetical protein
MTQVAGKAFQGEVFVLFDDAPNFASDYAYQQRIAKSRMIVLNKDTDEVYFLNMPDTVSEQNKEAGAAYARKFQKEIDALRQAAAAPPVGGASKAKKPRAPPKKKAPTTRPKKA